MTPTRECLRAVFTRAVFTRAVFTRAVFTHAVFTRSAVAVAASGACVAAMVSVAPTAFAGRAAGPDSASLRPATSSLDPASPVGPERVASLALAASERGAGVTVVSGVAQASGRALQRAVVTAYRAGSATVAGEAVATARTDSAGDFVVRLPDQPRGAVLYVTTSGGETSNRRGTRRQVPPGYSIGSAFRPNHPARLTLNERTTVATGFSLAQFLKGGSVAGSGVGMTNAVRMVRNLVDIRTGDASSLMKRDPNGRRTSTFAAMNSLANILARCSRDAVACARLESLTAPQNGPAPASFLQSFANIAKDPSRNASAIFRLAGRGGPFTPQLKRAPTSWLLAVKFVGNGRQFRGPGNIAFDAKGNVWTTNNYVAATRPKDVCAGTNLLKLRPFSKRSTVATYRGGGLSGAGFGIGIDPGGDVWVGNFGFKGKKCKAVPPSNSVSRFRLNGVPVSGPNGYRAGGISWPQGTVSDRAGTIWVANCGNDTVTRYPNGDPGQHTESAGAMGKPFDVAIDRDGAAWVTSSATDQVFAFNPDGSPRAGSPYSGGGLSKPLGIATDTLGNQWVANSGIIAIPCEGDTASTAAVAAKVAARANQPAGTITRVTSTGTADVFAGGGLTIPWGIATDGADNVWVANFGGQRVSRFCGSQPGACPDGATSGQPISPAGGYRFNGLERNTGINIDASGNVWLCNNWKNVPKQTNPGGDGLVAIVGAAAPVRMPLIGPPQQP